MLAVSKTLACIQVEAKDAEPVLLWALRIVKYFKQSLRDHAITAGVPKYRQPLPETASLPSEHNLLFTPGSRIA